MEKSKLVAMPNGLFARPGTSDEGTWSDVFEKGYHRPPEWLNPLTIIDVGAYVGYTTFDFVENYPIARVIALEPDEENYAMLLLHSYDMPKHIGVEYRNWAVWNYNGYGRLVGDAYNAKQLEKGATVRVVTLDNVIDELLISEIDFLKIDIEGAEKEVIKLGGHWPGITKCIKVECHGDYSVPDCCNDLDRLGFKNIKVDLNHGQAIVGWR